MANEKFLRQVLLVERFGSGQDVFWIPRQLAVQGKQVIDEAGKIWTVAEVYNVRKFEDVDRQLRVWAEFAETLNGGKRQ